MNRQAYPPGRGWRASGERHAFGTFCDKASDRPEKSPTVFNLGYTPEVAEKYPYVAKLSGGVATGHPRQRQRA